MGASPLAVKSKWLWDQTSRVPYRLNLTSPKVQGPRALDLPEPCSVCGLSRGQGGGVEILPDTEATGPDHPPLETKTCPPGLVVSGHHCTLVCNRTCVCVFGSEETRRGGGRQGGQKGKKNSEGQLHLTFKHSPRRTSEAIFFLQGVRVTSSSQYVCVTQFPMLEPLGRISPPGNGAFPSQGPGWLWSSLRER